MVMNKKNGQPDFLLSQIPYLIKMKKLVNTLLLLWFVLQLTNTAEAQKKWEFTLHVGTVYNVPLPLTISQNGYPDLKIKSARFSSEPFVSPLYWDWRFTRWNESTAWEFEVIHHKLYLDNKPGEVSRFSISHGFNMLMINRVKNAGWFQYRYGGGWVLSHPESTVRDMKFDQHNGLLNWGYYFTGPVVNFAVGKPIPVAGPVFMNIELKTTIAWSRVKIANGHADLYNWAIHAVCGVGFDFLKKE